MLSVKCHQKAWSFNESAFQKKLESAITLISNSETLEAAFVMDALYSRKVKIRSFFSLAPEHYQVLKEDIKQEYSVRLPNRFPPGDLAIRQIESTLDGIIFEGKSIYINSNLTASSLAKTIIHEVFHHFHHSLLKKETKIFSEKTALYRDEIRSFKAELNFEKPNAKVTRGQVSKIHFFVQSNYPELKDEQQESHKGYVEDLLDSGCFIGS